MRSREARTGQRQRHSAEVSPTSVCFLVIAAATWLLPTPSTALTGEHICHRVENYTVKAREQYTEPVEIHTLAWCLQIPPRCPQTRIELRTRWRMKTEVRYKSVPVCCEGYVTQELVGIGSGNAKCVPYCKKCRSGICTAPNECTCDPGFQGQDCAFECPQGSWGQNCENECNCLLEVGCDPVSGECQCPAGRMGPRCETECPEGQWGEGCRSVCLCSDVPCNSVTGECADVPEPSSEVIEASGNLVPDKSIGGVVGDYIDVIDFSKEAVLPRVTELDESELPSAEIQGAATTTTPTTTTTATMTSTTTTRSTERGNRLESQPQSTDGANVKRGNGGQISSRDFDERRSNFRVIVSPKTDYVKTSHKGEASMSVPVDVAAMVVVGALLSIGLTSVAALMIFQARSRLLKAALSVYSQQEKVERQYRATDVGQGGGCATKADEVLVVPGRKEGLHATVETLPRMVTRVNPMYGGNAADPSSTVLALDESNSVEYANGTVTIGIRLSSHIRDLLESHYDKPAPCAQQQQHQQQQRRSGSSATVSAPMSTTTTDLGPEEHVYAEIPHSAPFYFGKYA